MAIEVTESSGAILDGARTFGEASNAGARAVGLLEGARCLRALLQAIRAGAVAELASGARVADLPAAAPALPHSTGRTVTTFCGI